MEYFGFLGTLWGGRLRYTASMLFALAFIPQFLVGGLTGIMLGERLGKLHWLLMVIGTNVTFIPFFILGYDGMPRWMATYPAGAGFTTLSLISSTGAGVIGVAMCVFAWNLYASVRRAVPAGPNPWLGHTLEWATSSPPPLFNFNLEYPVIAVRSYAPLLDRRERRERAGERPVEQAGERPATERTVPEPKGG